MLKEERGFRARRHEVSAGAGANSREKLDRERDENNWGKELFCKELKAGGR